jgi:imidazolonepropionase-like amidohydrolase
VIRALAAAVAIVSGTVYTGEGPPVEGATVLMEGNRVAAVGRNVRVPPGAEVIEAEGHVITPGFVDPVSRLGLVEVSAEPSSVEGTAGKDHDPVRAALRAWDTFNPVSSLLSWARLGGLTSAIVVPRGGLISGQSAWVDLVDDVPVREAPVALHVSLRGLGEGPGGRARAFLRLREVLEDAHLYDSNRGPYIASRLRELSVSASDLEVLARVLDRDLRVVIEVDRAADIRTALELIRDHRLDAVLLGVTEGWAVAREIARAGVPCLVNPLDDLPRSFSSLQARPDNALRLEKAGVRVAFTLRGAAHFAPRLRQAAGNAVARGYPRDEAIAAITRYPAEIFGMIDAGTLRPGALANLVVWNGDPLELTSWPVLLMARGREMPLRTRQDVLTERYRTRPPKPEDVLPEPPPPEEAPVAD